MMVIREIIANHCPRV